jgi:ubiquinone/menaquinone biosynthesis C-methylase UbiE
MTVGRSDVFFARTYIRRSARREASGGYQHREQLLHGIAGDVLDLGAGHGLNFSHFPAEVRLVVGVEPNDDLRSAAAAQSEALHRRHLSLVSALGENLPLAESAFDAVVTSLVLCSVSSPESVLSEIRRTLKPGGLLCFYEHVASDHRLMRVAQRALDPAWSRLTSGCHTTRHTLSLIAKSGFNVQACESLWFSPRVSSYLTGPHILGRAVAS